MSLATACRQLRRGLGLQRAAQLLPEKGCTLPAGFSFNQVPRYVAMVSTAEVEKVAARAGFPITVDNISPNLVTAQYAGGSFPGYTQLARF